MDTAKKNRVIKVSKSVVGLAEKTALSAVLDNAYLGMGVYTQKFEDSLKEFLNAKQVICVNSGTAALHLALMSIGLQPADEVLVQSLTYVASFQAISAAGALPVACEIDPATCTIDLKDARKRLTPKTKAIMPVHYASRPGNLDEIYSFAKQYNLRVIEDAAHAFGTVYRGKKIGSFGDIVCFSFDGIKNITCGEGGAVVTGDKRVAGFIQDARLLGVKKDTEQRYKGLRSWKFDVTHQGYRYHLSNLLAAIGLAQLQRFENEFKPKRQALAQRYHQAFKNIREISLFPDDYRAIVPHIFAIKVPAEKRDALKQYLSDNNIESAVHYYPNHKLSFFSRAKVKLPVTEEVYRQLLSLPLHPDVSENEQKKVIDCVIEFFKKRSIPDGQAQ